MARLKPYSHEDNLREFEIWIGIQGGASKVVDLQLGVGSGGDHGSVVGAERTTGKVRGDPGGRTALFEGGAELGVGSDAAGDQDAGGVELLGGEHGAVNEIANDCVLEFADEGESLRGAEGEELIVFSSSAFKSFLA